MFLLEAEKVGGTFTRVYPTWDEAMQVAIVMEQDGWCTRIRDL